MREHDDDTCLQFGTVFLFFRKDNKQKYFIDVWPVDFFNPDDSNIFGTTSLFLMQLATILNMVKGLNKLSYSSDSHTVFPVAKKEIIWLLQVFI